MGVIDLFAACQINDMEATRAHYLLAIRVDRRRLYKGREYSVGARTN